MGRDFIHHLFLHLFFCDVLHMPHLLPGHGFITLCVYLVFLSSLILLLFADVFVVVVVFAVAAYFQFTSRYTDHFGCDVLVFYRLTSISPSLRYAIRATV